MTSSDIDMKIDLKPHLVIVGAGIAGLNVGIKYLQKYPNRKVVILEEYNYIGGRMVTYKKELENGIKVQWENGAGRIHSSHILVGELVDKYKLTKYPISNKIVYFDEDFITQETVKKGGEDPLVITYIIYEILNELRGNPLRILEKHTIKEIMYSVFGKEKADRILKRFPYDSEVSVLRADMALDSLLMGEMSTYDEYYGIREGIQEIVKRMAVEFEEMGGEIRLGQRVVGVDLTAKKLRVEAAAAAAAAADSKKDSKKDSIVYEMFAASKIVFAVHSAALSKIPEAAAVCQKNLKYLQMTPLTRIYTVFPLSTSKDTKKPWFTDLPKIVTNSPLRFIIPISEQNGSIMISYTDNDDTCEWSSLFKKSPKHLENSIMKEVRQMFGKYAPNIPDPIFFKVHEWSYGTTYWLPGTYDPGKASNDFLTIAPDIHVCGESFSLRQAWIEGALEHSNALMDIICK
jgi:monoamine oxidase